MANLKIQPGISKLRNCVVEPQINGFTVDSVDLDGSLGAVGTSLYSCKNPKFNINANVGVNITTLTPFGHISCTETVLYCINYYTAGTKALVIYKFDAETLVSLPQITVTLSNITTQTLRMSGKYLYGLDAAAKTLTQWDMDTGVSRTIVTPAGYILLASGGNSNAYWVIHNGNIYIVANNSTTSVRAIFIVSENLFDAFTVHVDGIAVSTTISYLRGKICYKKVTNPTEPFYELVTGIAIPTTGYEDPYETSFYQSYKEDDGSFSIISSTSIGRGCYVAAPRSRNVFFVDNTKGTPTVTFETPLDLISALMNEECLCSINKKYLYMGTNTGVIAMDRSVDMINYGKFFSPTTNRASFPTSLVVRPGCGLYYKGNLPIVSCTTVV